jgi:hypothetical protein
MERGGFSGPGGGVDGGGDVRSGRDQALVVAPDRPAGPADGLAENPAIARFLARLRPDLAATFSPAQLAAIDLHFGMRHRVTHGIDWRRRFRLPFLSGYVVLLAGRDNRRG